MVLFSGFQWCEWDDTLLAVVEEESGIKRWGSLLGQMTAWLWDQRNSPQRRENLWCSRWRWADLNHIHIGYCYCSNKWPKTLWPETTILLHFSSSEIQHLVQWASRSTFLLEFLGENLLGCLFQLLENSIIHCLGDYFTIFKAICIASLT